MRRIQFALIILVIITSTAMAKTHRAVDSPQFALQKLPMKSVLLKNGFSISVLEMPSTALFEARLIIRPKAGHRFWVPLAERTVSLLDQGTRRLSGEQIRDMLAANGLRWETECSDDHISLILRGPSTHALDGIALLADFELGPTLLPAAMADKTAEQEAGLTTRSSGPRDILRRACDLSDAQVLRSPDLASDAAGGRSIRREDLITFHRSDFRPAQSTLIVSGEVSARAIVTAARKHFGSWPFADPNTETTPRPVLESPSSLLLVPRPSSSVSYGALVFTHCGEEAALSAEYLTRNISHKFESSTDSSMRGINILEPLLLPQVSSSFALLFACPVDKTDHALQTILDLTRSTISGPADSSGLNGMQCLIRGRTMIELASVSSSAEMLADGVVFSGDPLFHHTEMDKVDQLTPNQFVDQIKHLASASHRLILVADSSSIANKIEPIRSQLK